MYENFFADWSVLLQGALTGLIFGFLLQKGGVTRYQTILGQFLFKDYTVLKVMLTAIVVGGIGIYAMRTMNPDLKLHIKSAQLLANIAGGLIFGVGMAVLGYCPGTGIAALGDGSRHAIPGLLGMLTGAATYAEAYPWLKQHVLSVWDLQKVTLPAITGISPWLYIIALLVISLVIFLIIEFVERKHNTLQS
jgi:hypothetical protein